MFLYIAAIGVAIALLLPLLIRLQLRPLDRAASRLSAVRRGLHSGEPVQPLAVGRRDEVGELIEGFNALLAEIEQRQAALSQSELLYSTAFQTSPDAVSITRWSDGQCLQINESYTRLLGWKPEELVGRSVVSVGLWRRLEDRRLLMDLLAQLGRVEHLETEWVTREGRVLQSNEVLQAYAIGRIVGAGRGVWAVTDQAVLLREDGQQGVTRIALNQVQMAQAVRGRFGHVLRVHTSGGAYSLFGVARELAAGFHQSLASLEVASQFDDAQAHSRHWRDDAPEGWLRDCLSDARQRLASG